MRAPARHPGRGPPLQRRRGDRTGPQPERKPTSITPALTRCYAPLTAGGHGRRLHQLVTERVIGSLPGKSAGPPGPIDPRRATTVLAGSPPPRELARVSEIIRSPARNAPSWPPGPPGYLPGTRHPGRGQYLIKTCECLGSPSSSPSPAQNSASRAAPVSHARCRTRTYLVPRVDDADRAGRVVEHCLADRAERHPLDAGAHDEHLRIAGGRQQRHVHRSGAHRRPLDCLGEVTALARPAPGGVWRAASGGDRRGGDSQCPARAAARYRRHASCC